MWGANEGGFMNTQQGGGGFDSPAGGGEKSGKGARGRNKNIVPVAIKQLMECKEDIFKIEDVEAQVVTVVGLVKAVDVSTTKISVHIDDQTGIIEAIHYSGTDGEEGDIPTLPIEGTYGRVVGGLRNTKGGKYIVIYKYFQISDMNELTCHLLETIQIPMKLKKIKEQEALKTGVGLHNTMSNTLSNSMMMGEMSSMSMGQNLGGNKAGFNTNQNMVLHIIQNCAVESGIHKDEIARNLKNKVSPKDIAQILEDLSGEGHIYSTVDDDHYKATE